MTLLLAFWSAFLLALVSPGPNFALLAGTAMRQGRRRALGIAAGLALGEAIWGFGAVFGVSALAVRYPAVGLALRLGGGAFLLWMGASALWAAARPAPVGVAPAPAEAGSGFWRGVGLMLLNPKAGVFWVSLSSLFLGAGASRAAAAVAVLGAVLMSLVWHGALAWLLSAAAVARGLARVRRGLEAALGVVLAGFGLKLLASG